MKHDLSDEEIDKLDSTALINRVTTGTHISTGRLSLFQKRHSTWLSAVESALPMHFIALLGITIIISGWLVTDVHWHRLLFGISMFLGSSIVAILVCKGDESHGIGGSGSETD